MYIKYSKYEKYSFLILSSFIFFPDLLINLFKAYECSSKFNDCFNCSICSDENINYNNCLCQWNINTHICESINKNKNFYYFYESFSFCNDSESSIIQYNFCGPPMIVLDKKYTFSMPKNNNKYGTKSIYCEYSYLILEKEEEYCIDYSKYNDEFYLFLIVEYNNSPSNIYQLEKNQTNFCVYKAKYIKLKLYFKSCFLSLPFNLIITRKEPAISISSNHFAIIIIAIVLSLILFSIGIYFLTKKLKQMIKQRQRTIIENALANRYGDVVDEEEVKKKKNLENKNKLKIENFLCRSTITKNIIRKIKNDYECSVCQEKFNELNKVSITPCKHFFHYDCLSSWLSKNIMNPRCPNCNADVLNEVKVDEIYITNAFKKFDNDIINIENKIKANSVLDGEIRSNNEIYSNRLNIRNKNYFNKRKIFKSIHIKTENEEIDLGISATKSEN